MSNELTFDLPGLLDVSAVQMTSAKDDVAFVASLAAKFNCKAAFALSDSFRSSKSEITSAPPSSSGASSVIPAVRRRRGLKCAEAVKTYEHSRRRQTTWRH